MKDLVMQLMLILMILPFLLIGNNLVMLAVKRLFPKKKTNVIKMRKYKRRRKI